MYPMICHPRKTLGEIFCLACPKVCRHSYVTPECARAGRDCIDIVDLYDIVEGNRKKRPERQTPPGQKPVAWALHSLERARSS